MFSKLLTDSFKPVTRFAVGGLGLLGVKIKWEILFCVWGPVITIGLFFDSKRHKVYICFFKQKPPESADCQWAERCRAGVRVKSSGSYSRRDEDVFFVFAFA